jgi:hypothetical protein
MRSWSRTPLRAAITPSPAMATVPTAIQSPKLTEPHYSFGGGSQANTASLAGGPSLDRVALRREAVVRLDGLGRWVQCEAVAAARDGCADIALVPSLSVRTAQRDSHRLVASRCGSSTRFGALQACCPSLSNAAAPGAAAASDPVTDQIVPTVSGCNAGRTTLTGPGNTVASQPKAAVDLSDGEFPIRGAGRLGVSVSCEESVDQPRIDASTVEPLKMR